MPAFHPPPHSHIPPLPTPHPESLWVLLGSSALSIPLSFFAFPPGFHQFVEVISIFHQVKSARCGHKSPRLACQVTGGAVWKESPWWRWVLLYRRIFFRVKRLSVCSRGFGDVFGGGAPEQRRESNAIFIHLFLHLPPTPHLEVWYFPERHLAALSVPGFLISLNNMANALYLLFLPYKYSIM